MLRLIFTVCLIEAPDTCEQREMLVYEQMSVMACVTSAMPELATWKETHPNWRIARWRCEDDRAARRATGADRPTERAPAAFELDATTPGAVPVPSSR